MNHDLRAYLYDICEACKQIIEFTNGLSFEQYASNDLVKAAVERKFVTIGEAMMRIKRDYPETLERISGNYRIIGFRNVLVHGYDIIDDATVWSAVEDSVPVLLRETEALLSS
jgi:uncharacterized protein with HEPN domain